jgi:uncharacterized membrane protein YozB (DUF420 family)
MIPGTRKFLFALIILSAALGITGILLFRFAFRGWYFAFFPVLILVFFLVNSGFLLYFFRHINQSDNQFIRGFMLSTGIKLMLYLILILVYVILFPRSAIPFTITVAILYIAYTAFDLYAMLSVLKRKKEKNNLPRQVSN